MRRGLFLLGGAAAQSVNCWDGRFTWEVCCDPRLGDSGNAFCWDGLGVFNYEVCCLGQPPEGRQASREWPLTGAGASPVRFHCDRPHFTCGDDIDQVMMCYDGRLNISATLASLATPARRCFVETGTYMGENLRGVLQAGAFAGLASVELDGDLFGHARAAFAAHPQVRLLHGDSGELLEEALLAAGQGGPCAVFLDAHNRFDQPGMALSESPLYRELATLGRLFPARPSGAEGGTAAGSAGPYVVVDDFDAFEHELNMLPVELQMRGEQLEDYRRYPSPSEFFAHACRATGGRALFRKLNHCLHIFWAWGSG